MTGNQEASQTHRDRSLGLVLFGVVEIILGVMTAMVIPAAALAMSVVGMDSETRSIAPVALVYGIMAATFIVLGIGSIRARRWAREVWLSLSWIWLLTGICSVAISWLMLPMLLGDLGGTTGLPHEGVVIISLITLAILLFVYVLLPGALLLFYRSPHVAATCLARDPRPQWTDHIPQRLVTLTLLWLLLAVSVVVMPVYSWIFPFFGLVATGPAGAAGWLISTVIFLTLAWGSSKQRIGAWWGALAVTTTAAVSTIVTFALTDMKHIVAAMNLPADQAAMADALTRFDRVTVVIFWCVVWGSFLIYLWVIRSDFDRTRLPDG